MSAGILVLLTVGALWLYHRTQSAGQSGAGEPAAQRHQPVALVKTVPLRRGILYESLALYGITVPAPGALQSVTVPFESLVRRVWVSDGQRISEGSVLVEIEPSPDVELQLEQARTAYQLAKQSFDHVQERYSLKLATNDQLLQARQVLEEARLRLRNIENRGVDGVRQIRAQVGGLISGVPAQEGAIVSAGSPLVGIVAQNRLEVRLGVEPEDIRRVQVGALVTLSRVNVPEDPGAVGWVRQVARAVNPSTRLIDVFVSLRPASHFVLNEYVSGKIRVSSVQGLIVPRSAVLPEADRYTLFTVKNGHAVGHTVKIGLEGRDELQIYGEGLEPGDPVVILGNYELKDGMPLRTDTGS